MTTEHGQWKVASLWQRITSIFINNVNTQSYPTVPGHEYHDQGDSMYELIHSWLWAQSSVRIIEPWYIPLEMDLSIGMASLQASTEHSISFRAFQTTCLEHVPFSSTAFFSEINNEWQRWELFRKASSLECNRGKHRCRTWIANLGVYSLSLTPVTTCFIQIICMSSKRRDTSSVSTGWKPCTDTMPTIELYWQTTIPSNMTHLIKSRVIKRDYMNRPLL